ncbi:hypothetical protein L1049_025046 [Liquidambar formosana]|uniref:Uncharacterized protein n=1 Tax=Liquidambar formosana TaxID=63359 RepID=A0AAP0S2Y4_LIQFO
MENTENPRSITTFQRRERRAKQKSHMGNAVHECLASFRRRRQREASRRARRKRRDIKASKKDAVVAAGGEEDEKAEVEKRIMALQRIVPGGESLGTEKLFEETAGYILALQCQVKAMKVLASFFEGLEKEKRKFGG